MLTPTLASGLFEDRRREKRLMEKFIALFFRDYPQSFKILFIEILFISQFQKVVSKIQRKIVK